jgi:hypothetical protein
VLVAELGVRQAIVARHAEDHAVAAVEFALVVGELGRLQRAAGRVVARVEVQHDVLLADERGQVDRLHVCVGQRKRRCVLSWLQHRGGRRKFYACDRV